MASEPTMGDSLILGADGKPMRRLLTTEIARASLASVRQIATGHPANGLTPERLAHILRAAEDGDVVAYLELAEQIEERYPHYNAVLGVRKRQVAQLPITVEAAADDARSKQEAQFVRDWLKRDMLEAELFDMLDAVGKGFSFTEIIWSLGATTMPAQLIWCDPRFFQFDRVDGRTPYLRDGGDDAAALGLAPAPNDAGCWRLPPHKFVAHTHPAKSGLPIRGGLARLAAWAYMVQSFALKDWVAFADVYGFPIRVGKYGPAADDASIRTLMRAVAGVATDAAAVIPNSMEMEFIEANSNGSADLYDRLCTRSDDSVSKAVLGQTATTDAKIGGLGSGAEHGEVRADIERADAKLLAATLNRDLVRPMIDFNFGRGGPDRHYPQINIGREDAEDVDAIVKNVAALVPLGLRVSQSVMRDKIGVPDPVAGEELLHAPGAPPAVDPMTGRPPETPPGAPGSGAGPASPGRRAPNLLAASHGATEALPRAIAASGSARALLVAAAARAAGDADVIDRAADALVSAHGREVLAPLIEPLIAALVAGASFEDAIAILDGVQLDDAELVALLERACGAAAVAGAGGQFDPAATAAGGRPAASALA